MKNLGQDFVYRLYDVSLRSSGMAKEMKSFIKNVHITAAGLMDKQLIWSHDWTTSYWTCYDILNEANHIKINLPIKAERHNLVNKLNNLVFLSLLLIGDSILSWVKYRFKIKSCTNWWHADSVDLVKKF